MALVPPEMFDEVVRKLLERGPTLPLYPLLAPMPGPPEGPIRLWVEGADGSCRPVRGPHVPPLFVWSGPLGDEGGEGDGERDTTWTIRRETRITKADFEREYLTHWPED